MSEFDPPSSPPSSAPTSPPNPGPPQQGAPFAPRAGEPPPPPGFGEMQPGGSNRRVFLFGAILLAVVVAAIAGVVLLTRSSSSETSIDTSAPIVDLDTAPSQTDPGVDPEPDETAVPEPPVIDPVVTEPVVTEPPATTTPVANLFVDGQVGPIIDQVAGEVGADPMATWFVAIYPEYMFVQVQDPAVPANIDEYMWRGELSGPEPVRLNGTEDVASGLYPSDEVDWSAIPSLVEQAVTVLALDDGAATHIIVERPLPFSSEIRMRVFVTGSRGDGYVDADASGTIFSVNGELLAENEPVVTETTPGG